MQVHQHTIGLLLSFLFIYLPFNSFGNSQNSNNFIKKTSTIFQKKIAQSLQQTLEENFPNIDFFSPVPVVSPNSATCYDLVTTCFTNGNRADTTVCSEGAVVQYGYNDRGNVLTDGNPNTRGVTSYLATVGQVGSVWGTAYDKFNNHLYVATFIRRHSDVGASGLGAIYQIDLDNPPVDNGAPCTPITPWLDINNTTCLGGGATLFPTVPTAASRGLGAKSEPSQDAWAFDKVGKEGIADIEMSEDGTTMYVTDMTNRQIVIIDMATQNCTQVPITNPCGGDSEYRPFAITENNGDVYIGVTCDGTGATRDTSHHVMRFDNPANPTGTVGVATWTTTQWGPNFFDLWQSWSDDYNADYRPGEFVDGNGDIYVRRMQSVLTDIEFDANGDMVIGLTSRHGWQLGWENYPPDNTTDFLRGLSYGDIQYATENAGSFIPNQANSQWTFYETAEFNEFSDPAQEGVFIGGLVVSDCCGTEYVTAHLQDPNDFESNGVAWMSQATGETQGNSLATGRLDLVYIGGGDPGAFGKSTALGDMEMLTPDCSLSISTAYSENCTGSGPYTADWKIGISAIEQPDNAISYQRNSEAIQTHTLTGTTDTLTFSSIPADGGAYDTIRVYFTNETTCGDTLIIKRPDPCPTQITDCSFATGVQTLAFQAEDFTSSSPSTGQDNDTWTQVADPSASNGFAMQSLDNDGTIYNALPDCCDGVGPEEAALMNFQVNLPTSDDYYIFVYSRRDNGSFSDDSYHIGINGVRSSTINSIGDEYGWSTDTLTGLSAGANTINIWQREDAVLIDRIVLSTASEITDTATVRIAKSICNCPISDTEIAGTVFEDWNYDGVMNQSDTVGVQGIQVDLFDDCGSVAQGTFTDEGGNYKFSGLSNSTTYRVEFTLPESIACWAKPTQAGADNGTTVQFVSTGTCTSLGIAEPADYCVTNPTIAMPCYLFGAHTDANAGKDALVSFDYNASIDDADSETPGDQAHPVLATYEQIGTVYGVAYDLEGHLYTSAYTKRHADYGPSGQGAIYRIEAGTGTISLFTDLGLPAAGANPHNGNWFNDPDTYDAVGKSGLGDLDIDAEGKNLYTIGLNDRKLYKIPIDGSSTEKFTIPNPCATAANDWRPFGIGMEKGKIYVGGICSAESTGDSIDIGMYIFEFDPITKTFLNAPVLSFEDFTTDNYPHAGDQWRAWLPNWPFGEETQETGNFYFIRYAQPMLADIVFDNGDMIIGIRDRFADQSGTDAGSTDTNDANLYDGRSNGDILRACQADNNTWEVERGGRCGTRSTAGAAEEFTGPRDATGAAGEYYFEDDHVFDAEVSLGALLQIPGFPDVAMSAYDPIHVPNSDPLYGPSFYDSGIRWMSNTTGTDERAYRLFDGDDDADGFFGKAAGVGDMGANCSPSPLEIGNYIWQDKDNDGIQDACESGIAGVNVSLFIKNGSGGCDSLTTIQTDVNGQYYFNENTAGLDTLLKDTVYYVVIGENGQWDMTADRLAIGGTSYQLSPANQGAKDAIDSDGVEGTGAISCMTGKVFATVETEGFGCINHDTDFGLYRCNINIKSVTAANCTETAPNVFEAQWSISVEATGLEGETINYRRNSEANATFTPTSGCDTTALTLTGIPADGGLHDTIYVFSTNDNTCADTFIIKRPAPCPISLGSEPGEICATLSSDEIKGTVYEDWNYDGIMNQSDTIGVQGVQINLINECGNSFGTTYTDANGNYRFAGLPEGITYRLAFVLPESVACWAKPTQAGADNGTTVQYVQAGECASLGVAAPQDYCEANPYMTIPCYENGAASGNTEPALVSFRYLTEGIPQEYDDKYAPFATADNPRKDAQIQEIGTTYGVGWQRSQARAFVSSLLRRHAGFGPVGIGGVYVFDYNTANPTGNLLGSIDLQGVNGIDLGSINRNEVAGAITGDFDLPQDRLLPSIDLDAFDKVGKISFGDADVFNDNQLWLVNLHQRALIKLDISSSDLPTIQNSAQQYLLDNLSGLPICDVTPLPRPDTVLINMSTSVSQNYEDGQGRLWRSSQYSDATNFTSDNNQTFANTNSGTGLGATVDNYLYQRALQDDSLNIHVGRPNGTYDVVLHLATRNVDDETLYDVEAEGSLVIDDFDLWNTAGGAYTAQTLVLQDIQVNDGQLNIQVRGIDENTGNPAIAYVRAVEIISDGTWVSPAVSSNPLRPFALKFHKGLGYLGLMCTGENSENLQDVTAFVLSFDPNHIENGFQEVASLPIDYLRESNLNSTPDGESFHHSSDWHPWIDTWSDTGYPEFTTIGYSQTYPQPILSDIEFTEQGDILLGFADRWGSQTGYYNYPPIAGFRYTGTLSYVPFFISTAGDLIKFCSTNGTYELEGTSAECPVNDPGTGNRYSLTNDGVSGNGEYFYGDGYTRYDPATDNPPYTSGHNEVLYGALAVLLGSGEIVTDAFDPIAIDTFVSINTAQTQGVRVFNTKSGNAKRSYVIVDRPETGANNANITNFGKGVGLGDIELLCAPAPIEIGNYVWEDIDGNGLQSACEPPIENVILTLYNAACEIVAIDTTDANGQYYFNDAKLAEYVAQSDTAIAANSTYHIVITGANGGAWTTADSTLSIGLNKYSLTSSKQGNDDELNSDGTIGTAASACNSVSDRFVFATVNTTDAGYMQHNRDFGLTLQFCPEIALSLSPAEVCAGDSTTLTLDFDSIAGNIAIYRHTSLLDSAAINATGQGGATFIDSTHTGVVFNEVDYIGGDTIELWNTSCQSINVAHWYVGYKFGYEVLATLTVVSGSLNILAGEKVVLTDFNTINMTNAPGSLVLFSDNNFSDPAGLEDYLQWGAGGQSQESVAVAKGIWTAGDFIGAIASGNTLQYDGYGNHSDDWFFGASTFGNSNVNTDTPLTTTFNSGALTNGTAAPITYYFYAILTDDNCHKTSNCQPVAIDSIVVNPVPDVTTVDADICEGLSIDLDTLVTNVNSTMMVDTAYFMTMQEAIDSTNAIASLVSPTITTEYYVRLSTNSNPSCYDIDSLTITINNIISSISTTCHDNGTGGDTNDDTFTITVNATNASPGVSNQYLVMYNGMTLNGSGTTYGIEVTVTHADFIANGSFSPILTIRDVDDVGCEEMVAVAAVANCSVCPPEICLPVKATRKGGID